MPRFNRIFAAVIVSLVVVGLLTVTARPVIAASSISGTVTCMTGRYVEGIWVIGQSSTSGWAWMSAPGNTHSQVSFSYTLNNGGSFDLHVGCGGTPQNWASTSTSGWFSYSNHDYHCYDTSNAPPYIQYRCTDW